MMIPESLKCTQTVEVKKNTFWLENSFFKLKFLCCKEPEDFLNNLWLSGFKFLLQCRGR